MITTPPYVGQANDFDFLVGHWRVLSRRLRQRHVGSDEWYYFTGVQQAWSHLAGMVSVDEVKFESEGFSGCTVRSLDLATRRWSIYWIDSRDGRLLPPVHGGWGGDRGEFYGDDDDGGRPVRVRFVWQRMGRDRARWEQAFSVDGEATWEINWIMEFTRVDGFGG